MNTTVIFYGVMRPILSVMRILTSILRVRAFFGQTLSFAALILFNKIQG